MAGYQHWKNFGRGGDIVFVTTTALDFAHVFESEAAKERMVHMLFGDHELYGATLYAFVVMRNHIHFISRLPRDKDVSWFVQRIKANSARMLKPWLSEEQVAALSQQSGLNGRSFWQRSFRSIVVQGEGMFWQKANYIHRNPVRAGVVASSEDYRFSSARLYLQGRWDEAHGISLPEWKSVHSGAVEA